MGTHDHGIHLFNAQPVSQATIQVALTCTCNLVSSPDHYSYNTRSGIMLQDSWVK